MSKKQTHLARQSNTLKVFIALAINTFEKGYDYIDLLAVCSSLDRAKETVESFVGQSSSNSVWGTVVETPVDASTIYRPYVGSGGYNTYTWSGNPREWKKQ